MRQVAAERMTAHRGKHLGRICAADDRNQPALACDI